jgi:hypothetical protein
MGGELFWADQDGGYPELRWQNEIRKTNRGHNASNQHHYRLGLVQAGKLAGLFWERDLMTPVVGRDPTRTKVHLARMLRPTAVKVAVSGIFQA